MNGCSHTRKVGRNAGLQESSIQRQLQKKKSGHLAPNSPASKSYGKKQPEKTPFSFPPPFN
jgi:hypothetical protein